MKALALDTAALVGETVLRVQDLGIDLLPTTSSVSARNLLRGCSFELRSGERLTLVGESGAGKSLLAQAIMGTLSQAMRATGRVQLVGRDTDGHRHLTRPLWGKQVVMLPQEPWSALNPVMRLRTQVAEAGRYAGGCSWSEAFERADRHLAALGLAHAGRLWLHQVSGGMAQRVGIACASQSDARVLIADEPTKGLDAGACEQVAHLLASAQKQGQALLTITHDLELAARLGGQIAVMRQGAIVEAGEAATVLQAPQHSYTRELVAAQPRHWPHMVSPGRPSQNAQGPVVLAKDIKVRFGAHEVLQGVDLDMGPGESVAVVGPSGCGKTTLGNALVGIAPVHSGSVSRLPGAPGWRFQKLYQDPVASFPAQQTLRRGLNDLLKLHCLPTQPLEPWLARLSLTASLLDRLPSQVSGGELQRMAILRAMLLEPVFLFADEPTSRLDVLTQRDTMAALCDSMHASGCAMLLVSHDRHLAAHAAHRLFEMDSGLLRTTQVRLATANESDGCLTGRRLADHLTEAGH